jgi:hypothetical protein
VVATLLHQTPALFLTALPQRLIQTLGLFLTALPQRLVAVAVNKGLTIAEN